MPRRVPAIVLAALVAGAACGSAGSSRGASGGAGGGGAAGGAERPDAEFVRADAGPGPTGGEPDADLALSCGGATDGGTACVQFDPSYASPDAVCQARGLGAVVSAPCILQGSPGGCHVIDGASGYTVWSYAPQTTGGEMFRCEQLGQSYVSAVSGIESDAASTLSSGAN